MMRVVVCLLLALTVTAARAEGEVTGDRKVAEVHFHAGEKAYAMQNFEAAATNFELAYQALPLPEIAFAVAQAYRRWYRIDSKLEYARKSADHYRHYLDKVKTGGKVGVAADGLGEMQREIDKLTAAGAQAAAAVAVVVERTRLGISPVDATEKKKKSEAMREIGDLPEEQTNRYKVTIDGKPVPPYLLVDVEPGPHAVRVEADGFLTAAVVVSVLKGEQRSAEVPLDPQPAKITVKTERGARVRVDGRAVAAAFEVPAGKHLVTVLRSGRVTVSREIEVGRGQALAFDQPLRKTPRRRAVPFVVAAGVVTGVFTLSGVLLARKLNGDAEDHLAAIQRGDQRPEVLDDYNKAIDRRGEVMTGSLITGGLTVGILGVAAAMYWLDRPDDEGMRLAPMAGSTTGVNVVGRF